MARGVYVLESFDGHPPPVVTSRAEYGTYTHLNTTAFDTIVVVNDTLYNRHIRVESQTVLSGQPPQTLAFFDQTSSGQIVSREEEILLVPNELPGFQTLPTERFTHGGGSLHRRTAFSHFNCTTSPCTELDSRMVDAAYRRH